ncbi:hypothetical protein GE09DRAFT_504116 [Coniochaeta sp. 2T2.1]|nr:hypothetical protein GE09DRAFT_504116 [Coniochaeta sp. 2T2.1]
MNELTSSRLIPSLASFMTRSSCANCTSASSLSSSRVHYLASLLFRLPRDRRCFPPLVSLDLDSFLLASSIMSLSIRIQDWAACASSGHPNRTRHTGLAIPATMCSQLSRSPSISGKLKGFLETSYPELKQTRLRSCCKCNSHHPVIPESPNKQARLDELTGGTCP